jgi:hypothetical protein
MMVGSPPPASYPRMLVGYTKSIYEKLKAKTINI